MRPILGLGLCVFLGGGLFLMHIVQLEGPKRLFATTQSTLMYHFFPLFGRFEWNLGR